MTGAPYLLSKFAKLFVPPYNVSPSLIKSQYLLYNFNFSILQNLPVSSTEENSTIAVF